MAYSKIILNGETLMDVTSDTVAAGSLLSGKTATKNDGTKVTGNIASKTASDLTASGATVTAAAGYYPSAVSKAVATTTHPNPTASINSSTGVVTASHVQETGYVTGGTTTGTLSLPTQGTKTITPSTTSQTAVAAGRYTTGAVTVAAMPSGSAGTPIATKGTISNNSISIVPSVTNTTGYITGGTKNGTAVQVSASELVSGTKTINENGSDIDVSNYAKVEVEVPSLNRVYIYGNGDVNNCYAECNGIKYYNNLDYFEVEDFTIIGFNYKGSLYYNGDLRQKNEDFAYGSIEVINGDVSIQFDYNVNESTITVRSQVAPSGTLTISDISTSHNVYGYEMVDFNFPNTAVITNSGANNYVYMRDKYYNRYYTKGDVYFDTESFKTLYFTVKRGSTSNYIYYNNEVIAGGEGVTIQDFSFTMTNNISIYMYSSSSESYIRIIDTPGSYINKIARGTFNLKNYEDSNIGIPYIGEGYPIMVIANVKNGIAANQDWLALDKVKCVGEFTGIKNDFNTAPTYVAGTNENDGIGFYTYKNLAGAPTSYTYGGGFHNKFYSGVSTSYPEQMISFPAKNIMRVAIGLTQFQLAMNIEYEYIVIYSE